MAATEPDAEVIPIGKRACERWDKPVVSSEKFPAADASPGDKKEQVMPVRVRLVLPSGRTAESHSAPSRVIIASQ